MYKLKNYTSYLLQIQKVACKKLKFRHGAFHIPRVTAPPPLKISVKSRSFREDFQNPTKKVLQKRVPRSHELI